MDTHRFSQVPELKALVGKMRGEALPFLAQQRQWASTLVTAIIMHAGLYEEKARDGRRDMHFHYDALAIHIDGLPRSIPLLGRQETRAALLGVLGIRIMNGQMNISLPPDIHSRGTRILEALSYQPGCDE